MMSKYTVEILDAVELDYDPATDEITDVLELIGEFYPDMVSYEILEPSKQIKLSLYK
tara:strand:+ start:1794 stop:1964 length:171 start_codon:yes stop_codon:yes gene_type:complete